MKKLLPFVLALILGGSIIILFLSAERGKKRALDERLSFRPGDRVPYGCRVAYDALGEMFPAGELSSSTRAPGFWDSLSSYETSQLLVIVAPRFNPTRSELQQLANLADNGNYVVISAASISSEADRFFHVLAEDPDAFYAAQMDRGMKLSITPPGWKAGTAYGYPGAGYGGYFTEINEDIAEVLGRRLPGDQPHFIRLRANRGWIYLHLEPFAFTNYFLLHRKNIRYFESLFSMIPPGIKRVVWDGYYREQRSAAPPRDKKNWFSVLMGMKNEEGHRSFLAAFLVLGALLLLYAWTEMRRKQRIIPEMPPPRNDSLDFVRTIGRLYYDKGDHRNLARKMSAYFMEHIRNRYKITTRMDDPEIGEALAARTGIARDRINNLVGMIRYAEASPEISARWLMEFHEELESFYLKA